MSLQKLKQRALANAEVKNEYDKLESEFSFIDQLSHTTKHRQQH